MPRRTVDRAPEIPTLGCPCGYRTPPPWTEFHVADHKVHHLLWDEANRKFNRERTTFGQATELCRALQVLVGEHVRLAGRLRRTIYDLRERVAQLEADHDGRTA